MHFVDQLQKPYVLFQWAKVSTSWASGKLYRCTATVQLTLYCRDFLHDTEIKDFSYTSLFMDTCGTYTNNHFLTQKETEVNWRKPLFHIKAKISHVTCSSDWLCVFRHYIIWCLHAIQWLQDHFGNSLTSSDGQFVRQHLDFSGPPV